MKYLITGGTGFIGQSIVDRLTEVTSDIFLIGRDWSTNKLLKHQIRNFNPDYIIHCAAEIKNSDKMYESNISMINWLLCTTKDINYKSFVNIGSSSEYGYTYKSISETDLLTPRTMYDATKAACTLLCQGFANEYNKPIVTIRPFSVYGSHEPENRLIPTLFRNIRNGVISNISVGVHDFIYINDFIDGLLSVLYSEAEIIKGDIVHLGNGIQYSNVEVYNLIKDLFKSNLEYRLVDNTFNKYDRISWVSDITYAKSKYKFNPKYDLQTGLKELYDRNYK